MDGDDVTEEGVIGMGSKPVPEWVRWRSGDEGRRSFRVELADVKPRFGELFLSDTLLSWS